MNLRYLLLLTVPHMLYSEQIIFSSDNFWGTGDNLTSLYNAYLYAKKYKLTLYYGPFAFSEQFECSTRVKPLPAHICPADAIQVRQEKDIINNLHNPHATFYVNVLSERLTPDSTTAVKAKRLLMPHKSLNLEYLNYTGTAFLISVHVRKGNNPENYQGELSSDQLYEYDRNVLNYSYTKSPHPLALYTATAHASSKGGLDGYWNLKYPPEQFYIDQVNRLIAVIPGDIVVQIVTDEKNPFPLVERFKKAINNPRVSIEFYDNTSKDFKTRIIEDLYILSQGEIVVHAESSYAFVADVMGAHKKIIVPRNSRWIDNKLIITDIAIQDLE